MLTEIDVLRDVAERLGRAGLPYMLTGSLAMSYYAKPRMTRDIDVVVDLETRDAHPFCLLFQSGYYISEDAVAQAIARRSTFNVVHLESAIKVDFIVRKDTQYRAQELARRRKISLHGFDVWVVSKEDLILSKLWWARDSHSEMQLRDVRGLAATGCDGEYIGEWASELGVAELWKECAHG